MRLAERVDLVVVEEAEQLRLQVEAHVRDLVQEEGAAGCRADDAGKRGIRAGEGAAAVAEQLALQHLARHRAAVEGLQRAVGAVGGAVDRAREHFLAGAGFAGQQDGHLAGSDASRDGEELGALLGGPDALGISVERFGGPEGGALFLVAAILVEAAGGRHELADGGDGAVVPEVRERAGQELPGFVAMQTEDGHVFGGGIADGGDGFGLGPPGYRDGPDAGGPDGHERETLAAGGLVEDREGLAAEDVGMSCQLDQGDGAVEIGRRGGVGWSEFAFRG